MKHQPVRLGDLSVGFVHSLAEALAANRLVDRLYGRH